MQPDGRLADIGAYPPDDSSKMPSTRFLQKESKALIFQASPPRRSELESFFVFALPKAGSSLLEGMLTDLCGLSGHTSFTPSVNLFMHGVRDDEVEIDRPDTFASGGYCFSGFRHVPSYLSPRLLQGRKAILLLRDPRDMLVSMYFSMRYSHVEPGQGDYRDWFLAQRDALSGVAIDDFACNVVPDLNAVMAGMLQVLRHARIRLYRYEDVIYRKEEWLADIAAFLDIRVESEALQAIAARQEAMPTGENINRHFRQGHPGDAVRKLAPETLRQVDELLAPQWQSLGYPFTAVSPTVAQPDDVLRLLNPPPPPAYMACHPMHDEQSLAGQPLGRQPSPGTFSFGSDGTEIVAAGLERHVAEGGGLRLLYSYIVEIAPQAEELIFGCRIVDESGNLLFGCNSLALDNPPLFFPEGGRFRITWDLPHPVAAGRYFFSAGCSYARNPTHFLARELNTFQVMLPLS